MRTSGPSRALSRRHPTQRAAPRTANCTAHEKFMRPVLASVSKMYTAGSLLWLFLSPHEDSS